jgi:hypothetical protein
MTRTRAVAATVAAWVMSQILAVVIHGFILAADYAPFEGTLLRAGQQAPMMLLPVVHLCHVVALVWVYGRIRLADSRIGQALTLGALLWLMGQAPIWLLWYAQQPWPGDLIVRVLGLELLASVLVGLTVVSVAAGRPFSYARMPG